MSSLLVVLALVTAAAEGCTLTLEDKAANAKLSFDDFDQKATLASTGRKLMERGCADAAAEAWADYLIRGPIPLPNQQRVLLWHLGQALAIAGDEKNAARVMAATRKPDPSPPESGPLNWNDYVVGTWAFLVKDRLLLERMRDAVRASPGPGNKMNGDLLAAMARCFDRPYSEIFDPNCGAE